MVAMSVLVVGVMIIVVLLAVTMPLFTLRTNAIEYVKIEVRNNLADKALLTFLRIEEDGKTVSDILAEHKTINKPTDIGFLQEYLQKLVGKGCYMLSSDGKILLANCVEFKDRFIAKTKIPVPYNPEKLSLEVELVID